MIQTVQEHDNKTRRSAYVILLIKLYWVDREVRVTVQLNRQGLVGAHCLSPPAHARRPPWSDRVGRAPPLPGRAHAMLRRPLASWSDNTAAYAHRSLVGGPCWSRSISMDQWCAAWRRKRSGTCRAGAGRVHFVADAGRVGGPYVAWAVAGRRSAGRLFWLVLGRRSNTTDMSRPPDVCPVTLAISTSYMYCHEISKAMGTYSMYRVAQTSIDQP
jgi:hypothetical protein